MGPMPREGRQPDEAQDASSRTIVKATTAMLITVFGSGSITCCLAGVAAGLPRVGSAYCLVGRSGRRRIGRSNRDTLRAFEMLARDRMRDLQEFADEVLRD